VPLLLLLQLLLPSGGSGALGEGSELGRRLVILVLYQSN